MSSLRTTTTEIRENLYGIRSARSLAVEVAERGDMQEAERHRSRAYRYAETVRNIIRERGQIGPLAYLQARQELPR